MKKTFPILVSSTLSVLLLFSACGYSKTAVLNTGIIGDPNVTAPGELPIVNERITLTCAIENEETVIDYETNAYTLWLEAETGIDLAFEVYDNLNRSLAEKIEADEKLPDIILNSGIDEISRLRYGINGKGAIIDLGDYMDNYSYYMSDIYTKSSISDISKRLFSIDGSRYFMPKIIEQTGNNYGVKTWINKTWLEKLGLSLPTTTAEFKEVMHAFQTMDPNGNGRADELGMTGNIDGWGAQPYRFLINSFLFEGSPSTSKYADVDEDGKLYLNFTRKEYKEALLYISELARDGLFDTASFTRSGTEMIEMASAEDNVIGCFTGGSPERVFAENRERMMEYEALPPLEGPDGVAYACFVPTAVSAGAYITKYCKHPLAAFRLLDFMMSKESTLRARYGIEGVNWNYADSDDVCIFESIGYRAIIKSDFQYGTMQNITWEQRGPEFRYADIANGMAWNGDPLDGEKFKADALAVYYNKEPEKVVTQYNHTADEYEQLARLEGEIIPYAEKQIRRFCTGEVDVNSEWDSFQAELKRRGADKYLELLQMGYDRYENSIWQ